MRIRTILIILFLFISTFSLPQSSLIDTTFNLPGQADTVNSYSVDYKSVPGSLQLATGENENLALKKYAYVSFAGTPPKDTAQQNPLKLVDGNRSSPSYIAFPNGSAGGRPGSYMIIDLQAVRRVKKVAFYNIAKMMTTRVLAFSIYTGMDTTAIAMEKVFQEPDNQIEWPVAEFNPTVCRYVKIVIDAISDLNLVVLSEIEVYGEGYLPDGVFVSSVRPINKNVNFETLEFEGEKPTGTSIYFSVRTGDTPEVSSSWSNWSDSSEVSNSFFSVFEPRSFVQYRFRLGTTSLETPKIHKVKINYDTINVANNTDIFISPQYAQILKEQTFTLNLKTNFLPNDYGIDTITITTPSPSEFVELRVDDVKQSVGVSVAARKIIITLSNTVKSDANIAILIKTTPYLAINPFTTTISSKLKHNPQRVNSKVTDGIDAWSIVTIGVPEKLIISGKADPNPFTPNGDGINDKTRIAFYLGNIAQPLSLIGKEQRSVTVKLYDLTGRVVRNLYDQRTGSFAFIAEDAIEWDGRDDNGKIVRPGVYIYQIFVNSDNGGEYLTRTVVVSY